jgi:alpha-tubulin suppressor-like RCC1 family protein
MRSLSAGVLGLAITLVACHADRLPSEPSDPGLDEDVLFVSEIVRLPESALLDSQVSPAQAIAGDVGYVSLSPGTVPNGVEADVRNRASGIGTTVPISDGGFDPIPLPAEEGDTIDVTVRDDRGKTFEFTGMFRFRPPVVVRTGPSRGETDVSLNASIIVVFSGPMSGPSITGETIHLSRDGQTIPAVVTLGSDGIVAEVTPAEGLELGTTYTLVITNGARDIAGVPLDQEVRVEFTTVVVPPLLVVGLSPGVDTVEAGSRLQVSVTLWDATHPDSVVKGVPIRWRSSDPSIARVDTAGNVQGLGVGDVKIVADVVGLGAFTSRLTFTPLDFATVSAGGSHTCGLTTSGSAFCWGSNDAGQLGTGDSRPSLIPTPVQGGHRFITIAAGAEHTCGVTADERVLCWGSDRGWQLGRIDREPPDAPTVRLTPVELPGNLLFQAFDAGGAHGCGVDHSGAGFCWGEYSYPVGRLLLDGPRPFQGGLVFEVISSGGNHDCGLVPGGVTHCWGRNDRGQLGDGTLASRPTLTTDLDTTTAIVPQPVGGGRSFKAIAAGGEHTCALSGGTTYCWGDNRFGQLGTGELAPALSPLPVPTAGSLGFASLSSGDAHTCGIAGGAGYCWGRNDSGQLGDGTRKPRSAPVLITDGLTFASIYAGGEHTCGLTTSRVLYCWGNGASGELGNGYTGVYDRPTRVELQR